MMVWRCAALALLLATPAVAQTGFYLPNTNPLGVNGPPVVVTVGTPYATLGTPNSPRSLQLNCTTGGTITFTEGGVAVQWMVTVGTTEIAHATTAVTSLGSAVCPTIYAHY